ncbi:type II toxin-antitoxin system HicA family toxin [Tomitella cavernea]|nr:type II toxin-antitoxin system HicA family toxin [Tomitella cavernea]
MACDRPARTVVKELRMAGFRRDRTVGSHSVWIAPGGYRVTVPDGHRVISAGVYRTIRAAIKEAGA